MEPSRLRFFGVRIENRPMRTPMKPYQSEHPGGDAASSNLQTCKNASCRIASFLVRAKQYFRDAERSAPATAIPPRSVSYQPGQI